MRVIDGDTFEAEVEIWPNITSTVSVRVRGIDAPETRRVGCEIEKIRGIEATTLMQRELYERNPDGRIRLQNVETDVWSGRVVADVFRPNNVRQTSLADQLLRSDLILSWTPEQSDIPWCEYFGEH